MPVKMVTPYSPRAQMSATVRWTCPMCGLLNRSRVHYGDYWVRCKASECRRHMLLGLTFHVPANPHGSHHVPPSDVIIPEHAIERPHPGLARDAMADATSWTNGQPIMHVVTLP